MIFGIACRAYFFCLVLLTCLGAYAVSGSGNSAAGPLETVRPTLTGITAPTSSSMEVTFSEPMLPAGLTTPENYVLSGPGAGTLGATPGNASGSGPVTLTWLSGEGLDGAALSLTVTGVQDALGNPIDTAANTAAGLGTGEAPAFSGLTVSPASAAAGETIAITFVSSEALLSDPEVTVNGNAAIPSAKAPYSYEYTILANDTAGPAVVVSGFDLAGNVGVLSAPGALEILPLTGLPVRAWPAALALRTAGTFALLLRRRHASALLALALALLAAPAAMAANPAVTNVAFVQQPSATGTEVIITYDLVAPNGPCDITVSLSKDGGVDGFAFPVTSVTGDISGVTTGTGRQIAWDIAADYPGENLPNAQLRITADDGIPQYTLTYAAGTGGAIDGLLVQTVVAGQNGTAATAVPDLNFMFTSWSDGRPDNPRTDTNVNSGITVTANFIQPAEMIAVAAGSFEMGNSGTGDDQYGDFNEYPQHTVTLSAYEIGKYEVTNQLVCDVFNWAKARGYFTTVNATTAQAFGQTLLNLGLADCHTEYVNGVFRPETRMGAPGGATQRSMASHPITAISWYGAVAFCNWLSEMEGLTPVYDTATWQADFSKNGYHLPTEAQWERAASWDAALEKRYVYGFSSDILNSSAQANYASHNPLGLTSPALTSPAGWFNGANVNPNSGVVTQDSVSPVGAYDMSGNVWEWCHDWRDVAYYSWSPETDPTGPDSDINNMRVYRGGSWDDIYLGCRSAMRNGTTPDSMIRTLGFRLARTLE